MAIEFTESADKHGIPHEYAIHVLTHALNRRQTDGRPGDVTIAFVGRPHDLSRDFIEVIAAYTSAGKIVVFHVNYLTDKWSWLLYEPDCQPWEEN
ncbi:hypothetical protein [Actinomyces urogenitalis]|uniref:hypothetical protein n=1 Tax=Actinomyces urogenitalis TaxID=103621 RepID=UPI0025500E4F|nr:hypothetical protein [Actinomyces urogenitalis]MDK8237446.1 hypothetical protein [Actinomyces urogenitalis]WOO94243.1 hypothetical protein R3I39_05850 [Actinomyces urogenitalis]